MPEYLLGAGQRSLVGAQFRRESFNPADVELGHFVNRAHVWRVRGSRKLRADTEGIDGRASREQVADLVLVQVARNHDLRLMQAGFVKDLADRLRQLFEVAAVEPDAPERLAQRCRLAGAFQGVVGIDQLYGGRTEDALQLLERLCLATEGHDPGMRRGSENRDAEFKSGECVRRPGAASYISGARGVDPGFGGMGAARAELDDIAAAGDVYQTSRLRCDQALKGDGREEVRLGDLSLDQRCAHSEQRLAREHRGALGDREQVAREAELPQVIEKVRLHLAELRQAAEVIDLLHGETQVLQIFNCLLKAGKDDVIPVSRQAPNGQLEGGFMDLLAGLMVAGSHGELIKIGEKSVHIATRYATANWRQATIFRKGREKWTLTNFPYFFFPGGLAGAASFTSPAALIRSSAALVSST